MSSVSEQEAASRARLVERLSVEYALAGAIEAGAPVDAHLELDGAVVREHLTHRHERPAAGGQSIGTSFAEFVEAGDWLAGEGIDIDRPFAVLSEMFSYDGDAHLVCSVWAEVHKDRTGNRILIPLELPLDGVSLSFLRELALRQRVRVLAEVVRQVSNAIRFFRLPESVSCGAVRNLGQLVALLRALISGASGEQAGDADADRRDDAEPLGHGSDVLHDSDSIQPRREGTGA